MFNLFCCRKEEEKMSFWSADRHAKERKKERNGFFDFSLVRVELESEPGLGDVESRPVAGVLQDGVAVETRAAFQYHKPETDSMQQSSLVLRSQDFIGSDLDGTKRGLH